MRSGLVTACMLLGTCAPAVAQVSIGINLRAHPELVVVPGYPVYYAPQLDSNFFVYDDPHWVYAKVSRYAGSWYDRPWDGVAPEGGPFFVLRAPVRYDRQRPQYITGWAHDAPPRWGGDWEPRRGGWDRWSGAAASAPVALPTYQYESSGDRYRREDQQLVLWNQAYRYRPQEPAVGQQFQHLLAPEAVPQRQTQTDRKQESTLRPDIRRGNTAVAGEGAVARRRADSQPPPAAGTASDPTRPPRARPGQPPQSANRGVEDKGETLNRQLPEAAGLLLVLGLLSGAGVPR
jgi:hypothetical protein